MAAVLIIALVSLALLGFFPGMAGDAKISQSNSYWKSEARPFGISEHAVTMPAGTGDRSGNLSIIFQLKDASGKFVMKNLTVEGVTVGDWGTTLPAAGRSFNAGEQKMLTANITSNLEIGDVYELTINITYDSPGLSNLRQYGVKTIIGKVSG